MKIVNSLATMESIVNKHRQLSWNGWTVVETFPSEKPTTQNLEYIKTINGK